MHTLQVVLGQKDRDDRINALIDIVADMFEFVHDAEPLAKIKSYHKIIMLIVHQTIDCGYFIREYAKDNFGE